MLSRTVAVAVARTLLALLASRPFVGLAAPRVDQLQVIGTHNSYHVAPHPSLDALIRSRSPALADSVAYSHRPLTEQLDRLGIRQIELDLYADPEGGRFARPAGPPAAQARGLAAVPLPDSEPLSAPGTKILHVPDFDFLVTVPTLSEALLELDRWSSRHPDHVPIFVLLELKSDAAGPEFTQPIPWSGPLLAALEREILDVLPAPRLLRPDDLRSPGKTLRETILQRGWPSLAAARGRFVFLVDNTDAVRDLALALHPDLVGSPWFVSLPETHPAAAWFKINDAVADFDRIQSLVRQGFLVRTRADTDTGEARRFDTARRDRAFASGAQLISTDYPEPNPSLSRYQVRWSGDIVARANPVHAAGLDAAPSAIDLETLATPGFEPFPEPELQHLARRAVRFHEDRRLKEASADYARLLQLDPAGKPTADQRALVLEFAPWLLTHPDEPFELTEVVAIHHPSRPCIGYHLFWADDIDFPEDNDPTDHEVVWVTYQPATRKVVGVQTYFHGRILAHSKGPPPPLPVIAVEWGKHGSLPHDPFRRFTEEPASLRVHWQRLHTSGIRLPQHPLAARWPRKFAGDWDDYRRFEKQLSLRARLERRPLMWVSAWANAVLDQHALPYNFAAKVEWPQVSP